MKIYLLSMRPFCDAPDSEQLETICLQRLDAYRREKALKLKKGMTRWLSIGAGLLLQLAYREMTAGETVDEGGVKETQGEAAWAKEGQPDAIETAECSLESLRMFLLRRDAPEEIPYRVSENGKPDFEDEKWHFSISHSEDYVCLLAAEQEVGIDLQRKKENPRFSVSERYFSEREKKLLAALDGREKEDLFYLFWVRKEAYAKLTGEGIARGICVDVAGEEESADGAEERNARVIWREVPAPEGYCMSLCLYDETT